MFSGQRVHHRCVNGELVFVLDWNTVGFFRSSGPSSTNWIEEHYILFQYVSTASGCVTSTRRKLRFQPEQSSHLRVEPNGQPRDIYWPKCAHVSLMRDRCNGVLRCPSQCIQRLVEWPLHAPRPGHFSRWRPGSLRGPLWICWRSQTGFVSIHDFVGRSGNELKCHLSFQSTCWLYCFWRCHLKTASN